MCINGANSIGNYSVFGVERSVNKVNSAGGHCGVIVLFIRGDQPGCL